MDDERVQIDMSAEEFGRLVELVQDIHITLSAGLTGCQPMDGRWVTVDERCQLRWPLATPEQRRRIRDVCLARYLEQVGRYPYKRTGCANGTFVVEIERVGILDRSIDIVRNESELREKLPLFRRRTR